MISQELIVFGVVALGLVSLAFVISLGLCDLMRRLAPRLGFVDRPGGHKGHRAPTPLGGGVAIWLTTVGILIAGVLVLLSYRDQLPAPLAKHVGGAISRIGELAEILILCTVIMVMGLIDDIWTINWRIRLGIQVACAAAMAAAGMSVTLFGPFTHPILGGAVTVLWIVGLTNAFNMLDNMDGLAASVGLIASALFCGAQVAVGSLFVPAALLVVVGALAGFLVHNHSPARLFMGGRRQ